MLVLLAVLVGEVVLFIKNLPDRMGTWQKGAGDFVGGIVRLIANGAFIGLGRHIDSPVTLRDFMRVRSKPFNESARGHKKSIHIYIDIEHFLFHNAPLAFLNRIRNHLTTISMKLIQSPLQSTELWSGGSTIGGSCTLPQFP